VKADRPTFTYLKSEIRENEKFIQRIAFKFYIYVIWMDRQTDRHYNCASFNVWDQFIIFLREFFNYYSVGMH